MRGILTFLLLVFMATGCTKCNREEPSPSSPSDDASENTFREDEEMPSDDLPAVPEDSEDAPEDYGNGADETE